MERDIGATISLMPVAWEGSPMMGRWESFFTTGMADTSRVFLVALS